MPVPPAALLASGWFPIILNCYWRAVRVWWAVPGLGLTSWFRTPSVNREAGGDPESQHLFGLAWDLDTRTLDKARVIQAARDAGLVAVDERTHIHIQAFPAGALARAGVRFPS